MDNVFLSLGSNLGNRFEYLQIAKKEISLKIGAIENSSSLYETEPWGYSDKNMYLNEVIQIKTDLKAGNLLSKITEIEVSMGRVRGNDRYEARIIDIDILLYGATVFTTQYLIIPHPQIPYRRFILLPLSEIAANVKHPVNGKTIMELLDECDDKGEVKIFSA